MGLCGSVVTPNDTQRIEAVPHLQDIEVPNYTDVLLLTGQDNPHLLKPLEVRCNGDNEPYGVRTLLGWTVNGPLGTKEGVSSCISAFIQASDDSNLSSLVERFWSVHELEQCPENTQMSVQDREVLARWDKSISMKDGH